MYAQVEKPKENKSRAVANSVAQKKKSGNQDVGFVDNRDSFVRQKKNKKIIEMNSSQQESANFKNIGDPIIQRLPYDMVYNESKTKTILNDSEGRASPLNNQIGHPRQHLGNWKKAWKYAEMQGTTKSIFTAKAQQDKAVSAALQSTAGRTALGRLDLNPNNVTRARIINVDTGYSASVKVAKAKKKKGAPQGDVKSWKYYDSQTSNVTVIVDSMGTNTNGEIHIQTAFPLL